MDKNKLIEEITIIKKQFGNRITIPAHHYQNEDIVNLSDFIGDSYKLAVESSKTDSEFIVFCGVRFMAESARILAKQGQRVILPNLQAGCPMADMIDFNTATKAFAEIQRITDKKTVPVAYMNSYADIKSFCGEHDGAICTSSNAEKILDYFFKKDFNVFFIPDYHLGKNTANKMGIKPEFIAKVDKNLKITTSGDPSRVKIFLWDGFCHVHQTFTESDIELARKEYPDIKIIVHPECKENIVNLSDLNGSTEQIFNTIKNAPSGSTWAVGTEANFINRLSIMFPDKKIIPLRISPCMNMEKITLQNLHASLQSIIDEKPFHEIFVDDKYRINAKKSLEAMINIVEKRAE